MGVKGRGKGDGGKLTELVPDLNAVARGLGHGGPAVELLRVGRDLGVVAEEGVERAERRPPASC